ncbi:hypothetical protein N7468_008852 [Penicillium chermesinum]|uniref:Uncharacterized protein n=1 Tax=Penicillium chermesinum TaxID=63820 RepID=A0A9W9TEG2_9EURO|nr:uncharacterized protein N7468_008852 [Penicillium chermesinum]KAJ5219648.1 hypothetical protein N7468_008852 [Penicillium chermesinum]
MTPRCRTSQWESQDRAHVRGSFGHPGQVRGHATLNGPVAPSPDLRIRGAKQIMFQFHLILFGNSSRDYPNGISDKVLWVGR